MRIATTSPNLIDAITDAWHDQLMTMSCPIEGTYLVHTRSQQPVEGVAVHKYDWGYACEDHGSERVENCIHIQTVKRERGKHEYKNRIA